MTCVAIKGKYISLSQTKEKEAQKMCKKNLLMEMKQRRRYAEMRLLLLSI